MRPSQLLGFALLDHPEGQVSPLISVEPGLTVLYGLNGAGKSRTIEDIARFWRGERSAAVAVVALPDLTDVTIDWFKELDQADWLRDWAVCSDEVRPDDPEAVLRAWVRSCVYSETADIDPAGPLAKFLSEDRDAGVGSEWQHDRLILVHAWGSRERPEWLSAPAFLTGAGRRFATDAAEILRIVRSAEDQATDEWGFVNVQDYATTATGESVLGAALYGNPALDPGQAGYFGGRHDRLLPIHLLPAQDERSDVDYATRLHLAETVRTPFKSGEDAIAASEELKTAIGRLVGMANAHYSAALLDAPTLLLNFELRVVEIKVGWSVEDDTHDTGPARTRERRRDLDGLSSAQSRWARWSIHRALSDLTRTTVPHEILLVDEPEAALHRSAESRVASYLEILGRGGYTVVAATHSPQLLDSPEARLLEVSRERGRRRISYLPDVARANLKDLGLTPSDLLARQWGFVLVEGEHDLQILRVLLGKELLRLRTEVLTLRGIKYLSAPRIRFLYDYTPAHVFLMLDNLRTDELSQIWHEATDLVSLGNADEAVAHLGASACLVEPTEEARVLRELLQAEVTNGTSHRLTPHGLSKADIIEYLPVQAFVPTADSWESLRTAHFEARAAGKNTPKDFKAWLRVKHHADTSPEAVTAAAESMTEVPRDLQRLIKTIEAKVARSLGPADLSEM